MNKPALLLAILALTCLTAFRNPPGAHRYIEMAELSGSEGKNELALEYFSKAIALEAENPALYTSRGFFLLKLNRFDEALQDFSVWIRLEPGNPVGYLTRGLVYSDLKKTQEADADFKAACRLGNKDGCSFAGNR